MKLVEIIFVSNLAQSSQQHPKCVAACAADMMVEFVVGAPLRSLLGERCAGGWRQGDRWWGTVQGLVVHSTTDSHAGTSRSSEPGPCGQVAKRKLILQAVGRASLRVWWTLLEGTHRGRVSLTPWVRALLQQLRQRLVHPCTVIHRLPLTDGTGVLSQAGEALSSSKLHTVHMFQSFGIDRCARTASVWRSRLHNGGARPTYFFLVRGGIVPASRSNIEGGIGAAALTDLLRIDACEQSIMR